MRSLFIHIPDLGESGTAPDPPEHRPLEKTPPRRRFLGAAAWTGRPFFNWARWWEFNGDVTPFFRVIFPIFRTNLHCVLGFPPKSPWRRQQLCQLHATESITGLVTGHMRGERFVFEALPCGDFCESILLCQTAQAALVNKSIMSLKDSTWKVSAEVLRCQQQDLTWKWQTKSSIINIILSIRVDKI